MYLSVPHRGLSSREADDVADGARLALSDSGSRAGGRSLRLVELDSAGPDGDTWDPSVVEENAKRAAKDATAVAYIGELDYGGSAISVPVTNAEGILQVSPLDGLTELTKPPTQGIKAGPERYFPSGKRNFVRLVPSDFAEAAALVAWARERGARKVAIVHDGLLFGRELATQVAAAAETAGIKVTDTKEFEAKQDSDGYAGLAGDITSGKPDAVIYTGLARPGSGRMLDQVERAQPGVPLYGSRALARQAGEGAGLPSVDVLSPVLPARLYPRSGRDVLRRLTRQRGETVEADALYGYDAMRIVLEALDLAARRDRADERAGVVDAALQPRTRRSVLGSFAVTPSGEPAPQRFGAYRRDGTRLVFEGVRKP
ncbi:MAG: branched-chain amino acid transport system substrate-binding protein [Thermoleophilaceae bacterium]|nr:branched-chain amino acid transport system substrate-binding protein [Thermoleophilaceae bacterium]